MSYMEEIQKYWWYGEPAPIPQSMAEFDMQLTGKYAHLTTSENADRAKLYSSKVGNTPEEGVTLLFIVPEFKKLLRTDSAFLFNGKFTCVPSIGNECQQLFVITAIKFNMGFPIALALMSGKTESAYTALFNKILSLEPEWNPRVIITDFEQAVITSVRTVFPNTEIQGFWYHLCKAVWSKVEDIGLKEACANKSAVFDFIHMLMALPLVPKDQIMDGFQDIRRHYEQNKQFNIENYRMLMILFEYYKCTWLQGINADIFSVSSTVFFSHIVFQSSYEGLETHMGDQHHPSPWMFLKGLIAYIDGVLRDYNFAIEDGEPHHYIWLKKEKIFDLSLKLLNLGSYSLIKFLICTKAVTPYFGVQNPAFRVKPLPLRRPGRQARSERIMPPRAQRPISHNVFDLASDSEDLDEDERPEILH